LALADNSIYSDNLAVLCHIVVRADVDGLNALVCITN
jgi:hypothetical protein